MGRDFSGDCGCVWISWKLKERNRGPNKIIDMENSYQFSINITTNITFLFINNYLSHQMFVKEFVAVDY